MIKKKDFGFAKFRDEIFLYEYNTILINHLKMLITVLEINKCYFYQTKHIRVLMIQWSATHVLSNLEGMDGIDIVLCNSVNMLFLSC